MAKQLQLKLKVPGEGPGHRISRICAKAAGAVRAQLAFYKKTLWKREYAPLCIAFLIFAAVSATSAFIVVYDTDAHITSYRKMQQLFLEADYDLGKIRRGDADVPRIFISTLPSDFNMVESPKEKKELFIKFLLPLVLKVNEDIRAEREALVYIKEKAAAKKSLSAGEKAWLDELRSEYKTGTGAIDELLAKLDEMPVAMALGMAAQETGWGESRFLLHGNSVFAEWTWGGEGMLPRSRKDGLVHKVKAFPTLLESVASYANNLNKTRYYAGFRRMRAALRKSGKPLRGDTLMSAMVNYSTQRDKYILDVKKIIRDNALNDFNGAKLAPAR
jgi:Bax protein